MCQMLGMSSNSDAAITFSFTGFAARGGRTAEHKDGWGIAFFERGGCRAFLDNAPACDSPLAGFVQNTPIKSRYVLAHVRKATQGAVTLSNCHPFKHDWLGQRWVFCHNGDLKGFAPPLDDYHLPVGETDSERAFCWLMQELRRHFAERSAPVAWSELAPVIAAIAAGVAAYGNFNFLLSNGQGLYAHCSTRLHAVERQHPFPAPHLVDCDMSLDLGRFNAPGDRLVVIATEPLTDDEPWDAFAPGESRVYAEGVLVWRSADAPRASLAIERDVATSHGVC